MSHAGKQKYANHAHKVAYSMYRVAQKSGATGNPISLQIFRKLHDQIAWKLVDFCNINAEHSH